MRSRLHLSLMGPPLCSFLAAVVLVGAPTIAGAEDSGQSGAAVGPPAPAVELTDSQKRAKELLSDMANHVAGLKSLGVTFRDGYDVVQSSGQKIEFGETRQVTLVRPGQMRVEEVSSDGARDVAVFDGRTISVFDADTGVYATAPQPGSIDDALAYFVRDLRMRMPLALLFTTHLPDVLARAVKTVDYVESTEILGVATHHIAGRTESVDFQFWIAEGKEPFPLRVVITYIDSPGQPQFWANLAGWSATPTIERDAFVFTPPRDARQIPFAVQFSRPAAQMPAPAASGEVRP